MDEKEMKILLDKTGLPVAYSHFPDNQKPPFICFTQSKRTDGCDNKNQLMYFDYVVELYTTKKDIKTENRIEELLNADGISYTSETVWLEDVSIFVTYYYFTTYKRIGGLI